MTNTQIIKPTLADIELITSGGSLDMWVVLPRPIPSMEGPKHRKEFEKAVRDGRYDLSYPIRPWHPINEAARELSQRGGIGSVQVFRFSVKENIKYEDGKTV